MSASAPEPLVLDDELKGVIDRAFDEKAAMVVAAVSADGKPLVSFRSSLKPYGDRALSFWARNAAGGTLEAIRGNPNVAVLVRSASAPMLQFEGRARIASDPAERDAVYGSAPQPEQAADAERKGAAVIIDLDTITGVKGFGADGPIFVNMSRRG
jgi:hypothetical protein